MYNYKEFLNYGYGYDGEIVHLRDKDDPSSLIHQINASEAPQLMREGIVSGGMIPKVECCIEAIRRGVKKVFIINGKIPHSILIETMTDEGIGTMFV